MKQPAATPTALAPHALPEDAVEIGKITASWGIKGWFKVQSHSASAEALFSCPVWYLSPAVAQRPQSPAHSSGATDRLAHSTSLRITDIKPHGEHLVAHALGIDDRQLSDSLRHARIWASRADFPKTAKDEYYWVDLIGLAVINHQGLALGLVQELIATGPQSVLLLKTPEGGERMIPFVDAYIDQVDLTARRIVADWLPEYD